MIILKNPHQLDKMRAAGRCSTKSWNVCEVIKAGKPPPPLMLLLRRQIRRRKAIPSFLNYRGYPKSICALLDDEVVHGIPSDTVVLREGSILSVDCGLVLMAGRQTARSLYRLARYPLTSLSLSG